MTYLSKAKKLTKYFFLAGYGHFDLTLKEVAEIIRILETSKNISAELRELYEKLAAKRLG